jgi:hypothetical protein
MPNSIMRCQQLNGAGFISGEPKLEHVLSECIILLRARAAGLSERDLRKVVVQAQQRLRQQTRATTEPAVAVELP